MSTRVQVVFFMFVLMSTVLVIVPVHAASKTVWTVDDDGGKDFTTIQAAIDAASSGDIIHVYTGTYGRRFEYYRQDTETQR